MPFEKGRPKTGGRQKGAVTAARKSRKFVEQLKGYGFNYPKELAETLLDIRRSANDPGKLAELKFFYTELKSLLPYMAPKLREKEVEVCEDETPATSQESAISTDDLLKAFTDEPDTKNNKGTSDQDTVGQGSPRLQVPAGATEDLQDVVGVEEEDE